VYQTGKKPAVDKPTDLKLETFRPKESTVLVPTHIGFANVFGRNWPMLGNDAYGDCVFAGGDHETSFLNWVGFGAHRHVVEPQVTFSENNALDDYGEVTGFTRDDPDTDQGTLTQDALDYRRKTGLIDANGVRHQIGAYVKIPLGNLGLLREALYLGEVVGLGIAFPSSAMDQFNEGLPWTPVDRSPVESGHYIPIIAAEPGWLYVVTWGKTIKMSEDFYTKYADEAYMILSVEGIYKRAHTNYGGYDWEQIIAAAGTFGPVVGD
jgi:hypothetical protein